MPTVQVRFAPPLYERFMQECGEREITPSEYIRRAVEAMMDRIDTKATVKTWGDRKNFGGLSHAIEDRQRLTPTKARGFAVDGSGEITADQQLENRQGELVRKKGHAK